MKTDITKKALWVRIIVFVLLTFFLSGGGYYYIKYNTLSKSAEGIIQALSYASPAIAAALTRLIFRDGFYGMGLLPRFCGRMKGYFLAVFLPVIMGLFAMVLSVIVTDAKFTLKMYGDATDVLVSFLISTDCIYMGLLPMFAEEFGWRGFLQEYLKKAGGFFESILLGGIIWGLWYVPRILDGEYFGLEGFGMPYMGILYMCVSCILYGIILAWIYKLTGSVWGACVCRCSMEYIVNNLKNVFLNGVIVETYTLRLSVVSMIVVVVPVALLALWELRKKQTAEE